jgi:hypothetical protein
MNFVMNIYPARSLKLAQALFEVLQRDEEDWKLISSLLGERETLRLEAKRSEQLKQQSMFDS